VRALALLLALALPGCLSAPIDRAADRADALVDRAAASARQIAQETATALDARMAALTADLAAKADAARAAALVDVDARLTAQRTAILADVDRQRAETLAALRAEREALTATMERQSAAWVAESAAWRATAERGVGEVAAIRAQVAPVLAAVSGGAGGSTPGPSPAAPLSPTPTQDLVITGAGAVASTLLIRYLHHRAQAKAAQRGAGAAS